MYLNLMKEGWKLHEIDQMDMVFFMKIRVHELKKQKKQEGEVVYIDQLGIF